MFDSTKPVAGLFDMDGVIINTESQYTVFWADIMQKYKGDASLAARVKGTTLDNIYETWFHGQTAVQDKITVALDDFETTMEMPYVPGFLRFAVNLKENGIKIAIVTSSNKLKMDAVYCQHPELKELFDRILTAELFTRSKPFPDCYLLGAQVFNTVPGNCIVFEDSFNGLQAGCAAGMHVIGLSTTNPSDSIKEYTDIVIPDFKKMTYTNLCKPLLA